jgi:cell division protein FtsB
LLTLLGALRRNATLLVILALMLAVYNYRGRPAEQRNRDLRFVEQATAIEIERLEAESERLSQHIEALERRDPATLSRVVHTRLLQGKLGVEMEARPR